MTIFGFFAEHSQTMTRIAGYVTALTVVWTFFKNSPPRRALGWLWRRNVSVPVSGWATHVIRTAAQPLVDENSSLTRAASLAQHEEQNAAIDCVHNEVCEVKKNVEAGFHVVKERLDALETRKEAAERSTGIVDAVQHNAENDKP